MRVIHFYNGMGGGVHSVIYNLISLNKDIRIINEVIYIIENRNRETFNRFDFDSTIKEQIFYYDRESNLYYQFKKLYNICSDPTAIYVAHDWFELGMISQLALKNSVIALLHGNYEYYYDLYQKHKNSVNIFLCVSAAMQNKLMSDCNCIHDKIFHFAYPVKNKLLPRLFQDKISIVFVASCLTDPNKNLGIIRLIDFHLVEQESYTEWHIIGSGIELSDLRERLGISSDRLFLYSNVKNNKIDEVYCKANIYLMPSFNEGLPVSLVEAMKNGLVPIVNSWNGSAKYLIESYKNGYIVERNIPLEYSQFILYLSQNPQKFKELSHSAFKISHKFYDEFSQVNEFNNYVKSLVGLNTIRKKEKVYGSRLDNQFIPSPLTKIWRKISNKHK
jgi:glycosyltransferase involved in cell wall biosynthesis